MLIDEATTPLIIASPQSNPLMVRATDTARELVDEMEKGRALHGAHQGNQRRAAHARTARSGCDRWRTSCPSSGTQDRRENIMCMALLARDVFERDRHLRRAAGPGGDRRREHRPTDAGPLLEPRHPPGDRGARGPGADRTVADRRAHDLPGFLPPLPRAVRRQRHAAGHRPRAVVHLRPAHAAALAAVPSRLRTGERHVFRSRDEKLRRPSWPRPAASTAKACRCWWARAASWTARRSPSAAGGRRRRMRGAECQEARRGSGDRRARGRAALRDGRHEHGRPRTDILLAAGVADSGGLQVLELRGARIGARGLAAVWPRRAGRVRRAARSFHRRWATSCSSGTCRRRRCRCCGMAAGRCRGARRRLAPALVWAAQWRGAAPLWAARRTPRRARGAGDAAAVVLARRAGEGERIARARWLGTRKVRLRTSVTQPVQPCSGRLCSSGAGGRPVASRISCSDSVSCSSSAAHQPVERARGARAAAASRLRGTR